MSFLTFLLRPHLLFPLPTGIFSLHRLESPFVYEADFLPLPQSYREYCGSVRKETWVTVTHSSDTLELILLGMNQITAQCTETIIGKVSDYKVFLPLKAHFWVFFINKNWKHLGHFQGTLWNNTTWILSVSTMHTSKEYMQLHFSFISLTNSFKLACIVLTWQYTCSTLGQKPTFYPEITYQEFDVWKMWILWKIRLWKCEFCEKWEFQNVNFWINWGFLLQCDTIKMLRRVVCVTLRLTLLSTMFG